MKPAPLVLNAALAILCLIWGSTWLVILKGLPDLPPLHGAAIRFTVATAVFWLAAPPLHRIEGGVPPPARLALVLGALNFATSYAIVYWAETRLPSGLASVLWGVFPMMMALCAHFFLPGERLAAWHWLGFAIGFAGVVLLFRTDLSLLRPGSLWFAAVFLVSPFVSAVGQTCVKRSGPGVSSVLLTRNALPVGAVLLWVAALLLERGAAIRFTPVAIASILYLAVIGTCLAFGIFFWLFRFLPAYKMSLIAYVTPVVALLLGWTFADERIGGSTLLGTALVLGGVGLVRR